MCDTTFAFSQRGGHFIQCPSRKECSRLPTKLESLLNSKQLQRVYHVALGFEDSFLVTWQDTQDYDRIDSHGLPEDLKDFVFARDGRGNLVRDIASIQCTLGPYNASFFVHDGSSYLWMNLPSLLLSTLQSKIVQGEWADHPRIVALGANNNFVLITEKNTTIWNLQNYRTGSRILESRKKSRTISDIHALFLHPYRYDGFVLQSLDGTLTHSSLPPHTESGVEAITPFITKDTKAIERRRRRLARRETERSDTPSRSSSSLNLRTSEKRDTVPRRTSNLQQGQSPARETLQRKPSSLQQRAQFRQEWNEGTRKYTAQSKGIKLSLNLTLRAGGLAKLLG